MSTPYTNPTNPTDVIEQCASFAMKMKIFSAVITHEPRSAPTQLPMCCFFSGAPQGAPGGFKTIKKVSDLQGAAVLMDVLCRIYHDALEDPLDELDGKVLEETTAIMRACHASVSMGLGNGIWTDANGADSEGLSAQLMYIDHDQRKFRVSQIYIPVVITNFFPQGV